MYKQHREKSMKLKLGTLKRLTISLNPEYD